MSNNGERDAPSQWTTLPIGELLARLDDGRTMHQGWSPRCETVPSESESEWGVLKTTSVQAGSFLPEHNKRLPSHLDPRPHLEVKAGDILVTCAGPRSRCGVACLVRASRARLMLSGKMYRFRPDTTRVDPSYLEAYLQSADAQAAIDQMKTGGNESGLNLTHDRFRKLLVPLAPLPHQRRIVAELEKQFSRLDEGVANLKRAAARLTGYRERVLDNAFAAQPNAALGELISEGPQNGLYLPKDAYGSGIPIVRIDDYQTDWMRPVTELRRVGATESQVSTWALHPGDLLVNRVNSMSHLGKCVVVPNALAGALYESNMMRFRLAPGVLPRYVELYLGSKIGKRRLTANAKWAVNQASINQKDVLATEIPLPGPEHQAQIVAELDRRLSIVREVSAEVDANLARSLGLRRSVLARAFALSGALEALA